MARLKKIDDEFFLPDVVIQHIQSFLSGEEAARTTILSKFWYRAWFTRPNLHFDERNFPTTSAFLLFAERTVERYQRSNLKIESLRLWLRDEADAVGEVGARGSFAVCQELIVNAVRMGVTDLDTTVDSEHYSFVVPSEVLESGNLIRLSLDGCRIDRGRVSCSKLESLILRNVCFMGHFIWDIHRSCPLVENLSISECFIEVLGYDGEELSLSPLGPFAPLGEQYVGSVLDGFIRPQYKFDKVKSLFLEKLYFDTSFFNDISSKFPCLKDLGVHDCSPFDSIDISSLSLERISISEMKLWRAQFDVPNLRKFAFSGWNFPCLYFKAASLSLKSDVCLTWNRHKTSWFANLQSFLKHFAMSKISLTLEFLERSTGAVNVDCVPKFANITKPFVENLMLSMEFPSLELLDGVFSSCLPKLITPCSTLKGGANHGLVRLLGKMLVQETSDNDYIPNTGRPALHDLQQVRVEVFEESVVEWRPLPWKTLLDASTTPAKVRFLLRWGLRESQ